MNILTCSLDSLMFDGEFLAGPVPTLFCDNPDSSGAALAKDPIKAHWDVARIHKCIISPELISLEDSPAFLKKPR